jgi:multidrug efflux pump subunit AcrA (membrane-fusion protein)
MNALKAELDAARIAKKQIEQQMHSQTVTAPLAGAVIVLYKHTGDFVGKGEPVAMIADFSKMYFTKLIEDEKIKNIAPIDGKFSLRTNLVNMTEKAFDSAARSSFNENTSFGIEITSILPPFSENVPVRSVTCEIDNRLGVMEIGVYTDIAIRKETAKKALSIPISTVFDREDPKVYVRDAGSRLTAHGIITGVRDAEYVEVLAGLEEGDVVITSGVEGLDLGARIDVSVEEEPQ